MNQTIDIENLGFDMGAHLLVKKGLAEIVIGSELFVKGSASGWQTQLSAWCREQGHEIRIPNNENIAIIKKGSAPTDRWYQAERIDSISEIAKASWGLAARGATVESGSPEINFRLNIKSEIWSNNAAELYAQAVAAQWNPENAIDWTQPLDHSKDLEAAVVQVMTYMIENENAALIIPARFLGQLHPHFREVQALLAIQVADEARHIEVFSRRIRLSNSTPAMSTVGGQKSLQTLLDEPNFSIAGFLLSVLGEGTFIDLLQFLHQYAPDNVTKQICLLAGRDESRHVAFGMSHLREYLEKKPEFRSRLTIATESRFAELAKTSGLNAEVFDSLIIIAAGSYTPTAIAQGYARVQKMLGTMEEGRKSRLEKLGFSTDEAKRLAGLHTRNFM